MNVIKFNAGSKNNGKPRGLSMFTFASAFTLLAIALQFAGLVNSPNVYADGGLQWVNPTSIAGTNAKQDGVTYTLGYDLKQGKTTYLFYYSAYGAANASDTAYKACVDKKEVNNQKFPAGCSRLTIKTSDPTKAMQQTADDSAYGGNLPLDIGNTQAFDATKASNALKSGTVTRTTLQPGTTTAQNATTNDGADDNTPACSNSAGALAWILCPVIEGLASAVDGIYGHVIQPLLITQPLSLNTSNPTFKAWSQFRILGDIFLIVALLVVVLGQSVGGGMIDAYTAKKILPRLLVAAIAINLSYYLAAIAVDVTNIIGNGIQNLIEAPFRSSNTYRLNISGAGNGTLGLSTMVGAGVAGVWAVSSFGPLMGFLFTFVLIPLFLTFMAIMGVVIIRRGLIVLLVLLAPVAFALYCLPNTEQYFKKWWDLFLQTLLVYPIIAVLFGIGNVLSVTVSIAGQAGAITTVISLIALVAPLFLIPFAFKLAGGVLGRIHDLAAGANKRMHEGYKGNVNDPNSRQNRARGRLADRNIRTRERGVRSIGNLSTAKGDSNKAKFKRALGSRYSPVGLVGAALNSGDLEYRRAELNERENHKRETKTGNGPDSSVRALFAEKGDDGIWRSRINGATFSDLEVAKARQLHGSRAGISATQAALNYELGKTGNDQEYENFVKAAPEIMRSIGYQDGEVNNVIKGVGYGAQAKRLDLKHSKFKRDGETWKRTIDYAAFTQDAAENFGSYPISNFKTSPIKELGKAYDAANEAIASGQFGGKNDQFASLEMAQRTKRDVELTTATLDSRLRRGDRLGQDDGEEVGGGTGGAGRVNDEIQKLVKKVRPVIQNQGGALPGANGNPTTPGSNTPAQGGGPTIITPGSPGFNDRPPGSMPSGN